MKPALVDTDIISFYLNGDAKVIQQFSEYLKEYPAISLSIITYYEIKNGLLFRDAKGKMAKFEAFVSLSQILPITVESANHSAQLVASLRKSGIQVSHTDALIAGIALKNGLTLVTNNTDDFKSINGLELENWSK